MTLTEVCKELSKSTVSTLINHLGEEWFTVLKDEFTKDYMTKLAGAIKEKRELGVVFPPKGEVFTAYKLTPYSKVRICIVGQDPYIKDGEAHGLAFSTANATYTPSLRRIEKAVRTSLRLDDSYRWENNLTRWATQGIFLLNTVLTVDKGKSFSHVGLGWEQFTLETVKKLDEKGVIFLLWGSQAQKFVPHINRGRSTIIQCEHPVAGSYKGTPWEEKDCFNRVNKLLISDKINW